MKAMLLKIRHICVSVALCVVSQLGGQADSLDHWEWRNPLPQGNGFTSVAYGNGLFVAVGGYGTILSSADGINWRRQDSDALRPLRETTTWPRYLYEIAYGNGLFVAVGGGSGDTEGLVLTSRDGANWQLTWLSGARLYAIKYAEGTFLAVGTHGKGFTSADGLNWTPVDTQYDASLYAIAFGNGKWVAPRGGVTILSSIDGVNWNAETITNKLLLTVTDVAYGNGLFVGVSYVADVTGYNIATSADGVHWTQRRSGTIEGFGGITYANGRFLALGARTVLSSMDGVNWTRHDTGIIGGFVGAAANAERFVAVGGMSAIIASSDGVTWKALSQGPIDTLRGTAYGNGQFVAVGGASLLFGAGPNIILTSDDGMRWTRRSPPFENPLNGAAYGNGLFVGVGKDGAIIQSSNTTNWAAGNSPATNDLLAVTYAAGQFVAVGESGTIVSSPDGTNWTTQFSFTEGNLNAVTYGGGQFVAVGRQPGSDPRGLILTSADGAQWQPLDATLESGGEFRGVAYGNGLFVAVGRGNVSTSPDGINWLRQMTPHGFGGVYAIAFVDGQFLAVGGGIWTSVDGEEWKRREQPSGSELNAAVVGADTAVVVGRYGTILQSANLTRPTLSAPRFLDGNIEFLVTGKNGDVFQIQASSSLTQPDWTDLGFVTNTLGEVKFTGPTGAPSPARFYRAVLRP